MISSSSVSSLGLLPSRRPQPRRKDQGLRIHDGLRCEKTPREEKAKVRSDLVQHTRNTDEGRLRTGCTSAQALATLRSSASARTLDESGRWRRADSTESKLPFAPQSALPSFLAYDRYGHHGGVLRFEGYFRESVPESPQEIDRTRRISIFFYSNDNTVEITEPRKENSGLVQGPFLKRHKVPKRGGGSGCISFIGTAGSAFLMLEDLYVGARINVYGRSISIVDADRPTRVALARMGRPQRGALAWPVDRYDAEVQARRLAGRRSIRSTVLLLLLFHPKSALSPRTLR